jgi:membrane-bound serine protease (ClpP class)
MAFLNFIVNPTVAYALLLLGVYGLVLEAFHPGSWVPGIIGTISSLLALYALQALHVSYVGLAVMTAGVALVIAESLTPTVGVLGIGGVIAFVIGSVMLFNTDGGAPLVNPGVIAGVAFGAIVFLGAILLMVMRTRRARLASGDQPMLDASGEVVTGTDAHGDGWAMINGERWQIRADEELPPGTHVRVVRRDGLLLWVVRA